MSRTVNEFLYTKPLNPTNNDLYNIIYPSSRVPVPERRRSQ